MICTTEKNINTHISTPQETKRDRLVAQWIIIDNRLVCQWIIAKD
jgi:hypothetical protein